MLRIKTKEASSLWIALLAAAIVGIVLGAVHVRWGYALVAVSASFCVVFFAALFIIRKYVAYKLKPIYSIVLSRACTPTRFSPNSRTSVWRTSARS